MQEQIYETVELPSLTYKLDINAGRILRTKIDGLEAVQQAVFKILQTERYIFPVYSWNYGSEFSPLLGKGKNFILASIQRIITDALKADERITDVRDFSYEIGENLLVKFRVISTAGNFESEVLVGGI